MCEHPRTRGAHPTALCLPIAVHPQGHGGGPLPNGSYDGFVGQMHEGRADLLVRAREGELSPALGLDCWGFWVGVQQAQAPTSDPQQAGSSGHATIHNAHQPATNASHKTTTRAQLYSLTLTPERARGISYTLSILDAPGALAVLRSEQPVSGTVFFQSFTPAVRARRRGTKAAARHGKQAAGGRAVPRGVGEFAHSRRPAWQVWVLAGAALVITVFTLWCGLGASVRPARSPQAPGRSSFRRGCPTRYSP
jgi:hypothetical protein